MKKCPKCSAELGADHAFCPKCGTKVDSAKAMNAESEEQFLKSYDEALSELEAFAKARAAPTEDEGDELAEDAEHRAAREAGGEESGDKDNPPEKDETKRKEGASDTSDEETTEKSVAAAGADDDLVPVDATPLLQTFQTSFQRIKRSDQELRQGLSTLAKAMGCQGQLIKSIASEIAAIGNQGRGRKSALDVFEKAASGVPPASDGPSRDELLVKSLRAVQEGKLTPAQASEVELYLNRGQDLPAHLAHTLSEIK